MHDQMLPITQQRETRQEAGQFWLRVSKLYEQASPKGSIPCPMHSLETKWGVVQHIALKSTRVYASVYNLDKSKANEKPHRKDLGTI
jgi:hypothetical protein